MTFSSLVQSIAKKEWWFVAAVTAVLVVVTSLPILYGFFSTPPNAVFTAMHFVSANDWFVYYSFINQARDGSVLMKDLFAAAPQQPVVQPLWYSVGVVARLTQLPDWAAFHLFRVFLIPWFVAIAYLCIACLFSTVFWRKMALLFVAFSSGLGTLLVHRLAMYPTNYVNGAFRWPMDLWVPDSNTFLTLYTSPHFIAATILLLVIFLSAIFFVHAGLVRYVVIAGIAGLVLFSFHPFQVIKVFLILAAFFIAYSAAQRRVSWQSVWFMTIFTALSLPAVLYYYGLLKTDWLTIQRAAQNINPTTPLLLTVVSFGGLFIFAVLGLRVLMYEKKIFSPPWLFVAVWAVVQFALLYAPVNYQRRLGLGIHLPLVFLTVEALRYGYGRYRENLKPLLPGLAVAAVLIFLPSTFFALGADTMVFSQRRELSYLSTDEMRAFNWLKENTAPDAVTFSSIQTGTLIPAYALRASYVSHPVETPHYRQKKHEPTWFFSINDVVAEAAFLHQNGIDYVFYGPFERPLGPFDPTARPYLEAVYKNDSVVIYRVL